MNNLNLKQLRKSYKLDYKYRDMTAEQIINMFKKRIPVEHIGKMFVGNWDLYISNAESIMITRKIAPNGFKTPTHVNF